MRRKAAIVSPVRTDVGRSLGSLVLLKAGDLGTIEFEGLPKILARLKELSAERA
jgi:hypothetical protein